MYIYSYIHNNDHIYICNYIISTGVSKKFNNVYSNNETNIKNYYVANHIYYIYTAIVIYIYNHANTVYPHSFAVHRSRPRILADFALKDF